MPNASTAAALAGSVRENIARVIVGQDDVLEKLTAALLCGGHVLLEDVPGTGKTTMARALAKSVGLDFARVQFTPDLLPADITGMRVFVPQTGQFTFVKGPVFTNILLADEINRATPRTQSALLECMEERQVTDGGTTYPLDAPFFVVATQNPVETQGTFALPEAQLDRFLMRLSLGYPDRAGTTEMLTRFLHDTPMRALGAVCSREELLSAQRECASCEVARDVMDYIGALCEAARDPEQVHLGPSPRAALALMRACQALACVRGRSFVTPDDVKALAVPVLAHRLILRGLRRRGDAEKWVEALLKQVRVPTEARA